MAKRRQKKAKKTRDQRGATSGKPAPESLRSPEADEIRDDEWDFGGLPDRDLKKNLGGCG